MAEASGAVRIGVIGMGGFGRQHAQTLAGIAEAELVALVARRQESLNLAAETLPGVPGFLNLEQAVQESGAEAWVVATSTAAHVPIAQTLRNAGKAVLLEKPVSASLEEAESLAPLVKPDSSNLMLGHIVLFNSEFRQLRDEIRRRGPVRYMDWVRHRPASHVQKFPGENPMHLTMVHDLYATQALLECAEPETFSGQVHRTEAGAVDLVTAQLRWPGGLQGNYTASFMAPPGMPGNGYDRLELFGEGWAARMRMNPRPIEVWEEKALWPMALEIRAEPEGPTGMMAAELRCFCRVVRGLETVPLGARYQDALQVQRWMHRIEEAYSGVV
jgi:predicted dehydrogenase